MSYAFTQKLPFTEDVFQRFIAALQDDVPDGLVAWVAEKQQDDIRLIQVWESEDHYTQFARERLGDIAQDGFFASTGYAPPDQEPPREPTQVLSVWTGSRIANPWPGSGTTAR